jgi:hypothetical protein
LEARQFQNSRSGKFCGIMVWMTVSIPDREISLVYSLVLTNNFPNGKFIKP